jgi:hypothetical protein
MRHGRRRRQRHVLRCFERFKTTRSTLEYIEEALFYFAIGQGPHYASF